MTRPIRFTAHALVAMARRGLAQDIVRGVVTGPGVVLPDGQREIRRSLLPFPPDGRHYLVRVVVEVTDLEIIVITAYRTSRFEKYGVAP